ASRERRRRDTVRSGRARKAARVSTTRVLAAWPDQGRAQHHPPADTAQQHRSGGIRMSLEGKRIDIFAEDQYQVLELWYPLLRFKEAGAEVQVVGSGRSDVHTSSRGYPVKVDVKAADVKGTDFDAVVIPGGYAPDH